MTDYRLLFPAPAGPLEEIRFSACDPGRALLLAQKQEGPAELWTGDRYLISLRKAPRNGFWMLYRQPEPVGSGAGCD